MKTKIIAPENRKLRILIVPDVQNWAYDIKANNIICNIPEVDWSKMYLPQYQGVAHDIDYLNRYDRVLLMGYSYFGGAQPADTIKHKMFATMTSHEQIRRGQEQTAKSAALSYARVGAVSPDLMSHLDKWGAESCYCPNGVDADFFSPAFKEVKTTLRVGWVGSKRADDLKGHDRLLRKIRQETEGSNVEFDVIYIDSFDPSSIKSRIEMLNFYNSIDVFLGTGELEGTPNPAFEAAACGKPLICTNTGAVVDLIIDGQAGYVTDEYHKKNPSRTIEQSVLYIKRLASSNDLVRSMGRNARREVENKWTWKDRANGYRKLLNL